LNLSQPYFERMWGWNSHSRNGDLIVFRHSWNFRVQLQRSKHLALRCSLYHWKTIEMQMSKMGLYGPFGHLQHKLWQKDGLGVKLAVWFPTTKSRELTRPWSMQVKCDTPLESSWGKLQVFFKSHFNRRFKLKIMISQSPESPNWDNFKSLPWESWDKKQFRCGCHEEAQRILYGGRWWLPLSLGRGESYESRVAHGLS
jgi:hypothetical protein